MHLSWRRALPREHLTSRILTISLDSAKTAIGYGSLWSLEGSPSENDAFITVGFTVGLSRVHFVWITPSLHPEIRSRTDLLWVTSS